MNRDKFTLRAGLVSIVTPVHNGETYLSGMLDSVLNQTYPRIELILSDDGSTDRTMEVAESYREKFAARGYDYQIVKGEHRNASWAINRGLPYVRGEYLIWPDSDDLLEPESVEKRVDFLQKNQDYHCVRSLAYYFDAVTGEVSKKKDEQQGDYSREDLFWDILEARTFVCCGCYMLKTECFFDIYPECRIPEYDVGQNFQMLLPYMYRHKCPTIRQELYGVAIRQGSHSRTGLTQAQEEKKYADYESLVDEIADICRIQDKESLNRIHCWKILRRYDISLKYGRKKEAMAALKQLRRCGGLSTGTALKKILWICVANRWVKESLYPFYQKVFAHRKEKR